MARTFRSSTRITSKRPARSVPVRSTQSLRRSASRALSRANSARGVPDMPCSGVVAVPGGSRERGSALYRNPGVGVVGRQRSVARVNPFRRMLGAAVLVAVLIGTIGDVAVTAALRVWAPLARPLKFLQNRLGRTG